MKVQLIAHTALTHEAYGCLDYSPHHYLNDVNEADELAEIAGRSCYRSWKRPNPATATNEGYLSNIISQGHLSVLEHASATFFVTGVSRALTHELIRHRHLSYSQLSQRFVNESNRDYPVLPPAARGDEEASAIHLDAHAYAHKMYEELVDHYTNTLGLARKQAREAARAVLPNQQETAIVVTGNMRAWREVVSKRADPSADAEIQLFAGEVLRQLKGIAPNTFGDM